MISLEELAVLSEKATQGEWVIEHDTPQNSGFIGHLKLASIEGCGCCSSPWARVADVAFIAALVNFYRSGELQRLAELAEDKARMDWLEDRPVEIGRADDESGDWAVWRITGGINDREWTQVGQGETVRTAIDSAREKRTMTSIRRGEKK